MKLIAKKPCSFGGKKFFIGDEIPSHLVLNPIQQEGWGILKISKDEPTPEPMADEETRSAPVAKKAPGKKGGKKPLEEAGEQ